jgi:hypothetical protein
MNNYAKKVWVVGSSVCFGYELDHLVLSPKRAREIGESLIKAADECPERCCNEGS